MELAQAAGEVGGHVILQEHRDDVGDRVFLDVVGLGMGAELVPVIFEVALFVAVAGFAGRIETGGDGRLVVGDKLPGGCFGLVDFGGKAVGGQSEQNSDPGSSLELAVYLRLASVIHPVELCRQMTRFARIGGIGKIRDIKIIFLGQVTRCHAGREYGRNVILHGSFSAA